MKKSIFSIVVLGVVLVMTAPFAAYGQDLSNYIVIKPGVYVPTGDLEDLGFDTGFGGEVALGHYFHRNIVGELGVGYLQSNSSVSGTVDSISGTLELDMWAIPVTATGKLVYAVDNAELYGGAGIGVYFVQMDVDGTGTIGGTPVSVSGDDDDTVFGGHVVAGGTVDLSSNAFIGIEGKYLFTDDIGVFGTDIAKLNGFMVIGTVGYRF